jgi:hypothetical protein
MQAEPGHIQIFHLLCLMVGAWYGKGRHQKHSSSFSFKLYLVISKDNIPGNTRRLQELQQLGRNVLLKMNKTSCYKGPWLIILKQRSGNKPSLWLLLKHECQVFHKNQATSPCYICQAFPLSCSYAFPDPYQVRVNIFGSMRNIVALYLTSKNKLV